VQIYKLFSAIARFAGRVRTRDEFTTGGTAVRAQRRDQPSSGWTLERIKAARDMQLAGQFRLPVALAKAMRTDDAMFTAYLNRIAPQSSVASRLLPASGVRGEAIQKKAATAVHLSRATIAGLVGTMADHGIAIGYVEHETDVDGTLVSMRLTEWPLEHVRYNPSLEILETDVRDAGRVPITHGDGTWIKFQKFDVAPWTQDAVLLPGAMVWGSHALPLTDWAGASRSHGQAKIIGKMPQGVSLQSADASGVVQLTPEARGYLQMLQDLISGEAGAGIAPFGSETQFLANGSTAWQVFSELILNREKAAMRIYTGTDAALGSVGGAPGVDIATLFGVATTRLQGDFDAIEQGLNTGLYQPWTAINFGDSRLAPRFEYQLPDPDADKKSLDRSAARKRLTDAIKDMRDQQLTVNQEVVNKLATELGVNPAPLLAAAGESKITIQLAPTDIAKVVRGSEARNSQGLAPFNDERDNMTITEIDAAAAAKAQAANQPPPAGGPPNPKA
jgi:hypothetical protein